MSPIALAEALPGPPCGIAGTGRLAGGARADTTVPEPVDGFASPTGSRVRQGLGVVPDNQPLTARDDAEKRRRGELP